MAVVNVPLGLSDWRRSVAGEPIIPLVNRYFEQNPTNLEDQVALISRPGLKRYLEVGEGPIRSVYSQPGSFNDSLFVVSKDSLFKITVAEDVTNIGNGIISGSVDSFPIMAATARIGSTPEYLYICDGSILWVYTEDSNARGQLDVIDSIDNGDQVRIGDIYYQFTAGSVDSGTPDGTSANPWLVAIGAGDSVALDNLRYALDNAGEEGADYSTGLVQHPTVMGYASTGNQLIVMFRTPGAIGNTTETTVPVGGGIVWSDTVLTQGGTPTIRPVAVPDEKSVVSVGFIAGFVIVIIGAGQGDNGRFYWIEPGEIKIDPLNFATAERSPDPILSVRVVGDQFWLLGTNSTEIWYPTGDPNIPFARVQGRLFDRGVWEGTDVQIRDAIILVDTTGVVYTVGEGGPQRISNNSIEQRVREAMQLQARSPED